MSKERIEDIVGEMAGVEVEERVDTKMVGDDEQLQAWQGPFAEYTFVPVPGVGEFAVPAFKVMNIKMVQEWDTKESKWVWRAYAKYRDATDAELEKAGIAQAKEYLRPSMDPQRPKSAGEAVHHSKFDPHKPPPGIEVATGDWNMTPRPLDPDFQTKGA